MLSENVQPNRFHRVLAYLGIPVLFLCCSACASGPNFVRPEAPAAPTWTVLADQ